MVKKIALAACALMAACALFAQTGQQVESGKEDKTCHFGDNWFISAAGGVQIYFGDHDRQVSFGDRIAPALDINVGKWFTPVVGVRLGYNGLSIKGATRWGQAHSTGVPVDGWGEGLYKSKFGYYNIHVDAMFNISNFIGGYKATRFYNCNPYVGVGVIHATESPKETSITGHLGILNSFRLCDALDLNVDLRGTIMSDHFDGEPGGRSGEGRLSATIGLTYKFNPRGWNRK